jgi:hypothetical protein
MDMPTLIIVIVLSTIIISGIIWKIIHDAVVWNGGVCKKTGKKWVAFDSDFGGDVGYCDNSEEHNTIWISSHWINKRNNR